MDYSLDYIDSSAIILRASLRRTVKIALTTSCFVSRDGVGATLRDKLDAFAAWAWPATLYHQQYVEPLPAGYETEYIDYCSLLDSRLIGRDAPFFDNELFIVEFLCHYPLLDVCRIIDQGHLIVEYPGITPPELYADDDPFRSMTERAFEHLPLLEYADSVITHSEFMRDELRRLHPPIEGRIRVLPLGVAADFGPGTVDESLRDGADPLLLYVGRLTGSKRVEWLLDTVSALQQSYPGIALALVGEHSRPEAVPYLRRLREQSARLGLTSRIRFVGSVDTASLAAWYRSADLFVTASAHEGFCIPVAEAMTSGLPSVVTAEGALPETLGGAGLLCSSSSPEAFAETVAKFLGDFALRSKLKVAALEESRRFSQQAFRERLRVLIDDVVSQPPIELRSRGLWRMLEATARLNPRYEDSLKARGFMGRLVAWFRRKVTLPCEVSLLRPISRQQTAWNELMIRELEKLHARVQELRRRLGEKGDSE